MSRRCALTGTGIMVGNHVSHANNKTKRQFLPNLCNVTLISDALQQSYKMRVSAAALRTVNKNGFDTVLLKAKNSDLSPKLQKIRRQLQKKLVETNESANPDPSS